MHTFIEKPFIPQKMVKTVIADYRISDEAEKSLNAMGIEIIKTTACETLYDAIKGHPDIILHPVGGNQIVLAPNVYDKLSSVFQKKGFAVTKGATWLTRNYPGNIAYNVLRIGSIAFHHTEYTDREIIKVFEQNGVRLVHIKQGYSKCSVCIVDEKTIITSDLKLSKAAEKQGIESLLVKPGGILLPGMEYGFIGGAGGLITPKKMVFTGRLENVADKNRIMNFLNAKGIDVKILSKNQITDIGSIIPLLCEA